VQKVPLSVASFTTLIALSAFVSAPPAHAVSVEGPAGSVHSADPRPGPASADLFDPVYSLDLQAAGFRVRTGENAARPPAQEAGEAGRSAPPSQASSTPASERSATESSAPVPHERAASTRENRAGQVGARRSGGSRAFTIAGPDKAASGRSPQELKTPTTRRRQTPRRRSIADRIVDRVPIEYQAGLFALGAIGAALALTAMRERRRARQAEGEALVDSLTGLPNRRAFERALRAEWERAVRSDRSGS
jgi:hypothetical protein